MVRMLGMFRSLAWVIFAALLVSQVAAGGSATAQITDVTWQPEGQVGRVLIQLNGPVTYRTEASSPTNIVVDIWQAHYAQWDPPSMVHPYVEAIHLSQITPDVARVQIALWRPARYRAFIDEESHTLTVVIIPPWMATAPLPSSVAYDRLHFPTPAGTTTVHVLRVNPEDPTLEIRPALAADMVSGFEPTSVIVTRNDAVAGINGGYFDKTGMPLGMMVINGELVTTPTDRRSVFVITREGKPAILPFEFSGRVVTATRTSLWVSGVNHPPHEGGLAVYTRYYGPLTPSTSMAAVVRNDVVEHLTAGRILIPQDGYVLAVNADDADLITKSIRVGDRLWLRLEISPDLQIANAVGGGPRLVKDGQVFVPFAWELFSRHHVQVRAPRTAVGITASNKLLLVTVDGHEGRQNAGMTLRELAELMVQLGSRDAMNLDGGGSATMVVGGRVVNDPSDGLERPVASAILVLHRPSVGSLAANTGTPSWRSLPLIPPPWDKNLRNGD